MITLQHNGQAVNINDATPSAGSPIYLGQFQMRRTRTGRELQFVEHIPEHLPSFARGARIELFDDSTRSGTVQPPIRRFFGYVTGVEPDGAHVQYTCQDPIARLHQILCTDVNGSPRLLFNVAFDDYDFPDALASPYRSDTEKGALPYNVSEMWRQILELHDTAIHAQCPGLPASELWDRITTPAQFAGQIKDHYVATSSSDPTLVLHEDLSFEPDRVIIEEQTLGDAFDQLRQFAPAWEFAFDPESLKLRWLCRAFLNLGASEPLATQTRTLNKLNDPSDTFKRPILSKEIGSTSEDRWTRVEIVGPNKQNATLAYKSSGPNPPNGTVALAEDWTAGEKANWSIWETRKNNSAGGQNSSWRVYRQYKLVTHADDPDAAKKKRILRWIREGMWVPGSPGIPDSSTLVPGRPTYWHTVNILRQYRPVLAAKFTVSGRSAWFWVNVRCDYVNGIVIANNPLVLGDIQDPATTFQAPDDVVLAYAWPSAPLLASYPTAPDTYEGTAYTQLGITRTLRFYEENYDVESSKKVNYQRLAKALWRSRGDVVHTGSIVVHGIDYSFEGYSAARTENNGRLNVAGLNDAGASVTTGWESIAAPVHEVEYDYDEQTTTISFNSDWAEYVFGDFDTLKLRVQEAAREQIAYWLPGGLIQERVPGRDVKYGGFISGGLFGAHTPWENAPNV